MRFTHTGPESYEAMVEMGLEVQPVHAGMSRFAHASQAWDLFWRYPGWPGAPWQRLKVGDTIELDVTP